MAEPAKPRTAVIRIWATPVLAGVAVAAVGWPPLGDALIYARPALEAGQWWRLWTGHLAHFTTSHLLWDLAVFLPAGIWLEAIAPRLTRWFLILALPAISGLLYLADPALARYAGLSAAATGLLVLLALCHLRKAARGVVWPWIGVLILVGAKIGWEAIARRPLAADFGSDIKVSTLAHVGGVMCAVIAGIFGRRSDQETGPT